MLNNFIVPITFSFLKSFPLALIVSCSLLFCFLYCLGPSLENGPFPVFSTHISFLFALIPKWLHYFHDCYHSKPILLYLCFAHLYPKNFPLSCLTIHPLQQQKQMLKENIWSIWLALKLGINNRDLNTVFSWFPYFDLKVPRLFF